MNPRIEKYLRDLQQMEADLRLARRLTAGARHEAARRQLAERRAELALKNHIQKKACI